MSRVDNERLGRVADLRRRVFHPALRGLHFARPIPIAVAGLLSFAALVTLAAKDIRDFTLKRLLNDQAQRKANQIAPPGRCPQLSIHQGPKLLARALRRG
jgi:hypothetical protein